MRIQDIVFFQFTCLESPEFPQTMAYIKGCKVQNAPGKNKQFLRRRTDKQFCFGRYVTQCWRFKWLVNRYGKPALNLGNYVQIRFVLESTDSNYPMANTDKSGWYIDNLMIGDGYETSEQITLNNIQPSLDYEDKQPNGYGILDLDAFIPSGSEISVDITDSVTNSLISADGKPLAGLSGPTIPLWGIDVDQHPFININIQFVPSVDGASTPVLYGYNIGTAAHISFENVNEYRTYNISNGVLIINTTENPILTFDSLDLLGQNDVPIYSLEVKGLERSGCNFSSGLFSEGLVSTSSSSQPQGQNFFLLNNGTNDLPNPIYQFGLSFNFQTDCSINQLTLEFGFGHILENPSIDFYNDGVIDWQMEQISFGTYGFQDNFWSGQSQTSPSKLKSRLIGNRRSYRSSY